MVQSRIAHDGEEFAVYSNGGDWLVAWHPLVAVPAGKAHGANGLCVTADGGVVLVSNDGKRWGWPGGRSESNESWEQTLRREILEETCTVVGGARLEKLIENTGGSSFGEGQREAGDDSRRSKAFWSGRTLMPLHRALVP